MVARAAEPGGCTMARLIGVVVSAAIALLSLTFTALSPAAAETDFPYWGSYGGTTHIARCQPGQYMVSFRGRSGDLIDQIEVLCAPINNDLTYGTSTPAGHGGANGGATFQPMGCLASEAVGGIAWMAGRDENDSGMPGYVDMFGATCRGLAPPHSRGKFLEQYSNDDPGAFANSWMRQQHELDPPGYNYDYVGKPANDTDANPAHGYGQQCPADELSVGLRFSSGAFINSIALICDTGPAELAARAAGTAGSLGDVPKPDAGINFSGKWDTNANGQKLTVTLTQDAKGYVTGTYPGGKITDGVVIGSTRFFDIERWPWPQGHLRHGRANPDVCEIGYTWLARPAIRTAANTEAKLLMLTHAFEEWQVVRVCLHTDARNERSRAAMERIGCQFEGILRSHRMAADFTPRDSARYSIVAANWTDVKQRLIELLDRP